MLTACETTENHQANKSLVCYFVHHFAVMKPTQKLKKKYWNIEEI